jgi:GNAT superfamily N-acetyltransferase
MTVDITLTPARPDDVPFLYECLKALRGRAQYEVKELRAYLERQQASQLSAPTMLVAHHEERPVGLLTVNRFAMPRYLGYGIELEEVIVHQDHRRMGFGGAMISAFLRSVEGDPELRTVRVRTDDHNGSGRLYARMFTTTQSRIYAKSVNQL